MHLHYHPYFLSSTLLCPHYFFCYLFTSEKEPSPREGAGLCTLVESSGPRREACSLLCSMERCPCDPSELKEEALALSRKPEDRDREVYVQIAQSLQGGEAHGARGEADKDLIRLSMQ